MKLSAIPGLPALVILVTSHSGGLGASVHISEDDALKDVVRECQQDNDAPDDLEPTIAAISNWIAEADIHYEFAIQPVSLPGFRVIAFDHAEGVVLDNRICPSTTDEEARNFAGMVWNQCGFGAPDEREVAVYLYRIGADDPILTIREDYGTTTLDQACDAFRDDPSKATAAAYRAVARQYHGDDMIAAETLETVLAETAAYV